MQAGDNAAVRAELERILSHPLFRYSRHYPSFLRYVVERTLEGHQDELKERTVGIEALGRPVSYDTAQDPVVRTTAAEVRKRLAQYYMEVQPTQVRLELPVGSYVPYFESVAPEPREGSPPQRSAERHRINSRWAILAVAATLVAAAGLIWLRAAPAPTAMERFWQPILATSGRVLISVGPGRLRSERLRGYVTLNTATVLSRIVAVLEARGKTYEIKPTDGMTFADLRAQPTVTVGGYNNPWTLKVTEKLRFRFSPDESDRRILDRQQPAVAWRRVVVETPTVRDTGEDIGLVARVFNPSSGQYVLVIAGVGSYGVAAAGEFAATPTHLEAFGSAAPRGWNTKNIQVVIATTVTEGVAGPPRVLATEFWD